MTETIGILGAGAGGTAWGQTLALSGHNAILWDQDEAVRQDINERHENRKYYPGVVLSDRMRAVERLEDVTSACQYLFVALPVAVQTAVAVEISPFLKEQHVLVQTSAGVRTSDGALLTQVWEESVGSWLPQVVIAGPNFALEMMEKKLTALVVAAKDDTLMKKVAELFQVDFIRPYYNKDIIGVQVGGAIKNVLAIVAGMCDGLELGTNARAAALCRGLNEMSRLARALGAEEKTFMGLSGMGDVVLHATSKLSRNYRFGVMVGQGTSPDVAARKVSLVEGAATAKIISYLAASNGLELSIVSAVDGVLSGDITARQAYAFLTQRPRQYEFNV
jgi:glycerol-3-phosphate dehydrogenase (NAD(P)+)